MDWRKRVKNVIDLMKENQTEKKIADFRVKQAAALLVQEAVCCNPSERVLRTP
jgi:hypothetical protein